MKGQTFLGGLNMSLSVSTITKEHTDFILATIHQLELELQPSDSHDEELLRRALFAVRNKFIYFDKYIPVKSLLQITVQDVRPAKVCINFQAEEIQCDCNKMNWCRHKVSVLLALYQHIDSVQEWVAKWRSKKKVSFEDLAKQRTPNSWKMMVQEAFSYYIKANQKIDSNLLTPLMESALTKLMNYIPFEQEWKPIYKLFVEVYALNLLWEYLEQTNSLVKQDHFERFFDQHYETISMSVEEVKGHVHLFATDSFFDELQIMVRTILLNRKGFEDKKIKLYLIFWDKVFTEKKRTIEELTIIEKNSSSELHDVVKNIFYILLKDVERLQMNMKKVKTKEIPVYLYIAQFAFSKKNNICGEIILKAMLPFLHDYIHGHLKQQNRKPFVQSIHLMFEKISLNEEEESMLFSSYGSYGLLPFSNYLLKKKRYEQWIALHQIHPSSISYLETIGLNEVIENEPKSVLPLLHNYAMFEIEQKSRINYKEAALILKKMRTACQKAGKMRFWQEYINQIQNKFKRLKAFQEELEKENILL